MGYFHFETTRRRGIAKRIKGRVQITTDQLRIYLNVIEDAFGGQADFAQLHKIFRAPQENETRYSPARCIGCEMKEVSGRPDPKHVSTSFVERQNWTVRTTLRRYTRLSNGFSRKLENHAAAVALNYFAYNFIKIHRTLRTSPAMASGVTDRLWSVEDLVALWEAYESRRERATQLAWKSGLHWAMHCYGQTLACRWRQPVCTSLGRCLAISLSKPT